MHGDAGFLRSSPAPTPAAALLHFEAMPRFLRRRPSSATSIAGRALLSAAGALRAAPLAPAFVALPTMLLCGAPAAAQYGPVDPYDSAVRTLRDGLGASNGGARHATMVALRGLGAPSLRPLLERLLASEDWSLRVDAVLGLAELGRTTGDDGAARVGLDLDLVLALPSDSDRETALGAALGLGLLDASQVEEVLAWDDLRAPQRALLALELRRLGGRPSDELLRRLEESRTPEVSAVGAALRLDCGADGAGDAADAAIALVGSIAAERTRSAVVAQVVDACSANGLRGAAPFAARLAELGGLSPEARLRTLGSLLVLDPAAAGPLLAAVADADRSQLALMRLASVLVASAAPLGEGDWNRIRNGDRLLETIADAGIAIGAGDLERGYRMLADLRHRVTLRAAVDGAHRAGPSAERAIGLAALELLSGDRRQLGPLSESLLVALARLAESEPSALRAPLDAAATDRELQEAILLALSSAGSAAAADVAQSAKGRASRLGEALIAVLAARHLDTVDATTLQTLGVAAGGGVAVDPTIRLQSAWLWLRHSDRVDDALAALVPSPTPKPQASERSPASDGADSSTDRTP